MDDNLDGLLDSKFEIQQKMGYLSLKYFVCTKNDCQTLQHLTIKQQNKFRFIKWNLSIVNNYGTGKKYPLLRGVCYLEVYFYRNRSAGLLLTVLYWQMSTIQHVHY